MNSKTFHITPEKRQPECAICFNPLERNITLNKCQHFFCYGCIMKWSEKSHSCPQCRQSFENFSELQNVENELVTIIHQAPAIVNFKQEKQSIAMIDLDNTYYEFILEQIDFF